jgi:hypothetical protein
MVGGRLIAVIGQPLILAPDAQFLDDGTNMVVL